MFYDFFLLNVRETEELYTDKQLDLPLQYISVSLVIAQKEDADHFPH